MLKIGPHLSMAKGYTQMGKDAVQIAATTFQFFTRNPRGTKAKALNLSDMEALRGLMQEKQLTRIVAHAPYTMNPCSADPHLRSLAAEMMTDDLARMEYLPGNYYNFHPGSHIGQGTAAGIRYTADMLNQVLKPDQNTVVLLETMSGKGTELGKTFEELWAIIDQVHEQNQVGICFDTCHLFAAGYDIAGNLEGTLEQFDRIIGLKRLQAVHLNDSMNPFGSFKDRHAGIGTGHIGLEAFIRIINHPQLRNLPFILETPHDLAGYAAEIELLKRYYQNS